MSLNWVMLKEGNPPFVLLPHEIIKFESSERCTLQIREKYTKQGATSASGRVFLTNQRVVFTASHGDFRSFSVLYTQVNTHKLEQPWFGPNKWQGTFVAADQSTGFIAGVYDFTIVFNEGGAFDYLRVFEEEFSSSQYGEQLPAYHE